MFIYIFSSRDHGRVKGPRKSPILINQILYFVPVFFTNQPETMASNKQTTNRVSSRNSDHSESSSSTNEPSAKSSQQKQTATIKRLPPIKAPVGLVPGPDLKNCKSKVGSLQNIKHAPVSSGLVIPNQKLNWNAKSKVGSLDNKEHKPGGGKLVVESKKLDWKTSSKVQSLVNINHKPGGGNVKIFNETIEKPKSNKTTQNLSSSNEEINGIQSDGNEAQNIERKLNQMKLEK